MSENSKIEWTDHTFNPWIGCARISPGCDNCYAAVSTPARVKGIKWGAGEARRRTADSTWKQPKAWNARHDAFFAEHGRRQRVFCASLADVFDNEVDNNLRNELLGLIYDTPNLDWLLLTKRIGNVPRLMQECTAPCKQWELPPNVWLGATIVNQEEADRDIPKLLATPAAVRFLSMEPLLGPVDLNLLWNNDIARWDGSGRRLPLRRIDWVIVGGESGRAARPMSIQWARSLRDQCHAANVPFLFKQWGEWAPAGSYPSETPGQFAFGDYEHDPSHFIQTDHYPRQFTKFGARSVVERTGKRAAGRKLDGVTHDGFPRGVE